MAFIWSLPVSINESQDQNIDTKTRVLIKKAIKIKTF